MANITGTEVRDRLRTITSIEVTDTTLASAAFIPAGDGWLNTILSNNGYTLSSLSTDKQALAKAAEIAFVARLVVLSAPQRTATTTIVKIEPISSKEKKEIADDLLEEAWMYLRLIPCTKYRIYVQSMTSDDWKPDGDDNTNLLWTDTEDTTASQWP